MDTKEEPKVTTARLNFDKPDAAEVPNAETVAALEDSRDGNVERAASVDELFDGAEEPVCEECQIGGPVEVEPEITEIETVTEGPVKSVADLVAEREALDAQIEAQKVAEKRAVMVQMKNVQETYGISLEEYVEHCGGLKIKRKGVKAKPKYRDPATGAIWTGRGKPPVWLRDKNFEDYLIPVEETASADVDSTTTETAAE